MEQLLPFENSVSQQHTAEEKIRLSMSVLRLEKYFESECDVQK